MTLAPLNSNFMLFGLIGLLISWFYLYPLSAPWGFTFGLFSCIMIVSSLISMTYGPVADFEHRQNRPKKKRR